VSSFAQSSQLIAHRPSALGIEAASFASGASKDIAESPTAEPEAEPERPNERQQSTDNGQQTLGKSSKIL